MARAEDIVVVDRIHIHETARRLGRGGIGRGRLRGRWNWERGRRSHILELNLTRSFDEVADEDFGVTVYGCYDGGREGLRESLVGNLVSGEWFNFVTDGWEWSFYLADGFFLQFDSAECIVALVLLSIESFNENA